MRNAVLAALFAACALASSPDVAWAAQALTARQSLSTLSQAIPLLSPTSTVTSPDGRHVYVSGRFDNAIAIYARNTTTGALSYVGGVLPSGDEGVVGIIDAAISPDGAHVYAASYDGSAIGIYARNAETGLLTWVGRVVDEQGGVDGLAHVYSVAVSPDGQFVYATPLDEKEVAVFARNPSTGTLFFIEAVANAQFFQPKNVAVSADSQSIYVAAGRLFVYRRTGAGSIVLADSVFFPAVYQLAVSADGRHLYATDNNLDRVLTYAIDPFTGTLAFVDVEEPGVTGLDFASGIATSPDGRRVYATGEVSESVAAFDRDATTGALTFAGSFFAGEGPEGGFEPLAPAVSADGGHLYVSSYRGRTVETFDTGRAVRVVSSIRDGDPGVTTLADPRGVAVSADGANVYATSLSSSALNAFARDASTGALTPIDVEQQGQGGVDALVGARAVAVAPDGAHVYAVAQADGAVVAFARDAGQLGAGHLSWAGTVRDGVGGVEGIGDARQIALSHDGRNAYVTSGTDGFVTWFARDPVTGLLTQDGQYPFNPATGFEGVAVSPDDRHVYVAAPDDWALLVFERSDFDGSLLLQQTVSQGGDGVLLLREPESIAVSADGTRVFAGCADSDAVLSFARNAQTGTLSYQGAAAEGSGGVTTLLGVAGLAADPLRPQVYAAASGDHSVTAFRALAGDPVALDFESEGRLGIDAIAGVAALAAAPDGVHLYAAAPVDDAIVALAMPEPEAALASTLAWLALVARASRRRRG